MQNRLRDIGLEGADFTLILLCLWKCRCRWPNRCGWFSRSAGIKVVQADMLDMPFGGESFDVVIEKGTMVKGLLCSFNVY